MIRQRKLPPAIFGLYPTAIAAYSVTPISASDARLTESRGQMRAATQDDASNRRGMRLSLRNPDHLGTSRLTAVIAASPSATAATICEHIYKEPVHCSTGNAL